MSRIFISHSSKDNAAAVALRDWLVECGWDDLFLDVDPERGIVAGERWERALYEAANRCEAVVFLFSRAWLASRWCLQELQLARKLNKRIFGVIVDDTTKAELPAEVSGTWQLVNLATGTDHQLFRVQLPGSGKAAQVTFSREGLTRLRAGLSRAGLDPGFFAWPPASDPQRPPYRGLRPLEAEDAGIFFGREAATIEALDRLRGLREAAPPRWLAILGASGAGKSSFLRAGILPRLARDDRNFLTLPVVRPERAALSGETGLIRSLESALRQAGIGRSRAAIREAVESGSAGVRPLLEELAQRALPPSSAEASSPSSPAPPALVLSIDQGEELFLAEGAAEGQTLLALLRELSEAPSPTLIVLVTIRTDAFEQLQSATALEGLTPTTQSLPPMPRGAYQTVIEGPARRLTQSQRSLRIEPALTQQLLADLEAGGAKDALPLLAFTLERLYLEYGGDGDLSLEEYQTLGGIRGSLEAAVAQALSAADADAAVPRDREARLALLRRALIPWLAGIDPVSGSPRRRVARFAEIPAEARPLVNHLVEARLLAVDVTPEGERTVEPAHEALLRQWGLLQGWLEEDFAALTTLESVQRAARDWSANNKTADWLAHRGGRLEDAERLRERSDLAEMLGTEEWAYLSECQQIENLQRHKEIKNESQCLAALARAEIGANSPYDALKLALAGWPRIDERARPQLRKAIEVVAAALPLAPKYLHLRGHTASVNSVGFSRDGTRVVTTSNDGTARIWDALSGAGLIVLRGHEHHVETAQFAPDGTRVVTASSDGTARIWDVATGEQLLVLRGHRKWLWSAQYSPDGTRIVTTSRDGTARVWNALDGAELVLLKGHETNLEDDDPTSPPWIERVTSEPRGSLGCRHAGFCPSGSRVVAVWDDLVATIYDAASGAELAVLRGHLKWLWSANFSPDGTRIVTAACDGTARIWNAASGFEVNVLRQRNDEEVRFAAFSGDGTRVVTGSNDQTAEIWDAESGVRIGVLRGHGSDVSDASFSADGMRVVTVSCDGGARIWDTASGAEIYVLRGRAVTAAAEFSPDGTRVVTASMDGSARIWNVWSAAKQTVLRGHNDCVRMARFCPSGTRIVTASNDGTARIWDAKSGVQLTILGESASWLVSAIFSPDGTRVVTASVDGTTRIWDAASGTKLLDLRGHSECVWGAQFSPDGTRVVTASSDGTARIWDGIGGAERSLLGAQVGKERNAQSWEQDGVSSAIFSADGMRVVTASNDETARIWDATSGTELVVLRGHGNWVNGAEFSADGAHVVTASSDATARIWDAAGGVQLMILQHADSVVSASFSKDGKRVVTTSWDGIARIWDAKSGTELVALRGHDALCARFSADATRVVTAGDSTARIWDAASGAELVALRGHTDSVSSAEFSADSTSVVTASGDRTARVWTLNQLEHGDAIAVACARLGDDTDLTQLSDRLGLVGLTPICGSRPPQSIDWSKVQ